MKKIVLACLFGFVLMTTGCGDTAKKPDQGTAPAAAPAGGDPAKPADAPPK
jgi:hypothetical protein